MIISWSWLKDYVPLNVSSEELESRLMLAGFNHEGTHPVDADLAIDLEITSNRPDCQCHIGIAREASVIFGLPLKIPAAEPQASGPYAGDLTQVSVECPELCPRYTARVIRGVKVGPSPAWLQSRLHTLKIVPVNNVVDITNYVMFECGQPLHAFDFDKLAEKRIVVREARPGEKFLAINHKEYPLAPGMCVIADAKNAVALGGVMGGADSEIAPSTRNLLIEAAEFLPASIRNTARALSLHSDSSYRFERGIDPGMVDWASRRCSELILKLAGGELAQGVVDVSVTAPSPVRIPLRISQLKRVLGIDIPMAAVERILTSLGNTLVSKDSQSITVSAPGWRRDLTREIDLVEEVGRIHGYDHIPEDVSVPMAPSTKSDRDRVLGKIRQVLVAAGFHEALTVSVVEERLAKGMLPWCGQEPWRTQIPILRGATCLRQSLVPSLLAARQTNESLGNDPIDLFETARVYWPQPDGTLNECRMLAITSGRGFLEVKALLNGLVQALNPQSEVLLSAAAASNALTPDRFCAVQVAGQPIGWLAELSALGRNEYDLRGPAIIAEIRLEALEQLANLVPKYVRPPQFPTMLRDLNLVVNESTTWATVAATARKAVAAALVANPSTRLESVDFQETYRDGKLSADGKKSVLFTLCFRDEQTTMTGNAADAIVAHVITACQDQLGAQLRG